MVALRVCVVGLVCLGVLAGCSSETNERSFCDQAWEYRQFEARIGEVAGNSAEMESFVENWEDRLNDLSQVAPDEALTELSIMTAGVEQFHRDLDAVDYDLFALPVDNLMSPAADDASARFDLILADECQIKPGGAEILVPAPDPLDESEFDDLIEEELDQGTVEEELRTTLRDQLGLSEQESICFTQAVDLEDLERLLDGTANDAEASALLAALDSCGITLD